MSARVLITALLLASAAAAGCFSPEAPPFYTCSTSQPSCPASLVCIPVSGLDSAILTDWRYERSPAVCMPLPKLDRGASKPDAATDTR